MGIVKFFKVRSLKRRIKELSELMDSMAQDSDEGWQERNTEHSYHKADVEFWKLHKELDTLTSKPEQDEPKRRNLEL